MEYKLHNGSGGLFGHKAGETGNHEVDATGENDNIHEDGHAADEEDGVPGHVFDDFLISWADFESNEDKTYDQCAQANIVAGDKRENHESDDADKADPLLLAESGNVAFSKLLGRTNLIAFEDDVNN